MAFLAVVTSNRLNQPSATKLNSTWVGQSSYLVSNVKVSEQVLCFLVSNAITLLGKHFGSSS